MKHLLITIAALVLVGCGESQQSAPQADPVEPVAEVPAQPSFPPPETKPVIPVTQAAKQELLTTKAPSRAIHWAARTGRIETVKQAIADGADVNAKSDDGSTPLLHAVSFNENEIAELLIDKGADINVKDDTGLTPLHIAKSDELFELLIANGADVNAKDKFGRTPFYYRSKRDSMRVNQVDSINTKPLDDNTIGPAMPPLPFVNELNEPEK